MGSMSWSCSGALQLISMIPHRSNQCQDQRQSLHHSQSISTTRFQTHSLTHTLNTQTALSTEFKPHARIRFQCQLADLGKSPWGATAAGVLLIEKMPETARVQCLCAVSNCPLSSSLSRVLNGPRAKFHSTLLQHGSSTRGRQGQKKSLTMQAPKGTAVRTRVAGTHLLHFSGASPALEVWGGLVHCFCCSTSHCQHPPRIHRTHLTAQDCQVPWLSLGLKSQLIRSTSHSCRFSLLSYHHHSTPPSPPPPSPPTSGAIPVGNPQRFPAWSWPSTPLTLFTFRFFLESIALIPPPCTPPVRNRWGPTRPRLGLHTDELRHFRHTTVKRRDICYSSGYAHLNFVIIVLSRPTACLLRLHLCSDSCPSQVDCCHRRKETKKSATG